jgi:menaquinone-dependent protoporphyrinogen IX oxidase
MRALVIYDTTHGNTKKIAETIAETLSENRIDTDCLNLKEAKKLGLSNYDLIVIGSPTKFGTMTFAMKSYIAKLNAEDWNNTPFAAFDTENPENIVHSRVENKNWSAAEKISEKLKEKSLRQISPVLKAQVHDWKGPLLDGEIERTKAYASDLAIQLKNTYVAANKTAGA